MSEPLANSDPTPAEPVSRIDREAFERIYERHLIPVDALSFADIGDIFGQEFWLMLVYTLMDSQDAARAIAGAINRLKKGRKS